MKPSVPDSFPSQDTMSASTSASLLRASSCAVVFGASQGLGAALAVRVPRRTGCGVVLSSRNAARLDELAGAINAEHSSAERAVAVAVAAPADVRSEQDAVRVMALAEARFGGVRDVYFCTGVNHDAALAEWESCEAFRDVVLTNLVGAGHAAFAALPHLARSRGTFVVVSSAAGVLGCVPGGSAYAASKAGLDALFFSLAVEFRQLGVKTLVVEPPVLRRRRGSAPGAGEIGGQVHGRRWRASRRAGLRGRGARLGRGSGWARGALVGQKPRFGLARPNAQAVCTVGFRTQSDADAPEKAAHRGAPGARRDGARAGVVALVRPLKATNLVRTRSSLRAGEHAPARGRLPTTASSTIDSVCFERMDLWCNTYPGLLKTGGPVKTFPIF